MSYPLLFGLWWLSMVMLAPAQSLRYDVYHGEDPVGTMQVVQHQQGGLTTIRLEMQVEVKLLVAVQLRSTYETRLRDGRLVAARVRTYRNGDLYSYTNCWREEGSLQVDKDGERFSVAKPILYTIAQTYFQPPAPGRELFSERWGRFQRFEAQGEGVYVQHLSNGDKSYYRYQGNTCQSVTLDARFFTLHLKKK